jgi:CBS domain-containing protein
MVARDIMTREVVTISPEATAREAVERLHAAHYGALPVMDETGEVVGVVSYQDILRLALPEYLDEVDLSFLPASAGFFPAGRVQESLGDVQVKDFMRPGYLPQVAPTEPVAEVARIMLKESVRRVVVVEGGRLVGIISRGDIVGAIVKPAMDREAKADP